MMGFRPSQTGPRIALYSHDTMGLGHIRRNQLIAKALAAPPLRASVLLITGVREAGAFPVPHGIDSISLPAYCKEADGSYGARSLDIGVAHLSRLRSDLIDMALRSFAPDLFIADNVPLGALSELAPALKRMRAEGETRCVLGLRDILDDPQTVAREWQSRGNFDAIRTYYDAVWIYGDPALYDSVRKYRFPADIAAKTAYLGLLDPCPPSECPQFKTSDKRLILCSAGGGQDGYELAQSFARAELPVDTTGMIVTGPFMPRDKRDALHGLAQRRNNLKIVEAIYDPIPLLCSADSVIGMAGYNSVNEMLALGKRALLVPRTMPRTEQLIRAERLAELGLVTCLKHEEATPGAISRWLKLSPPIKNARARLDFSGRESIIEHVAILIGEGSSFIPVQPYREEIRALVA